MGRPQKMGYCMTLTRLGIKDKTLIALMVLNITLIVSVVVVVSHIHTFWKHREEDTPQEEKNLMKQNYYRRYCFRSGERQCLDRGFDLKQTNNQTVCCGKSNEHLYSVMSEAISGRLKSDARKELHLGEVRKYITQLQHDSMAVKFRPVAHVGILSNGNLTESDPENLRLHWERNGELSFVSGGVIHGGDRLIVNKTGFYYVYTGLQFTIGPERSSTLTIVAFLFRHVNGTRESQKKLMMSRESSCKWTRGGDVKGPVSLHMAGIYLLRPGEEISVFTSHHRLLHRSAAASYLGLHMV